MITRECVSYVLPMKLSIRLENEMKNISVATLFFAGVKAAKLEIWYREQGKIYGTELVSEKDVEMYVFLEGEYK